MSSLAQPMDGCRDTLAGVVHPASINTHIHVPSTVELGCVFSLANQGLSRECNLEVTAGVDPDIYMKVKFYC